MNWLLFKEILKMKKKNLKYCKINYNIFSLFMLIYAFLFLNIKGINNKKKMILMKFLVWL